MTAAGEPSGHRGSNTAYLWVLAGAIAVAATVLYAGPVRTVAPGRPTAWLIALAIGFLIAEVAVVHYDFLRQAHSFSLSEVVLVVGLFFASPEDVVVGSVIGGGVALLIHRRQTGLKLLFNLGTFALASALAVVVFWSVLQAVGPPAPDRYGEWYWLAALLAAVTSSAVSMLAVFLAISLADGTEEWRRFPEQLTLALLATTGSASLGILGALAVSVHVAGALLLAVPVATFLLAYRAYVVQRQERDSLEFLYQTGRLLETTPDVHDALAQMLSNACEAFRSEVARFALVSYSDPRHALLASCRAGQEGEVGEIATEEVDPLLLSGMALQQAQLLSLQPPLPSPDGTPLRDAMIGPLGRSGGMHGALLVGNRVGLATSFGEGQLRLFQTLVSQIDVSLENGRLAQMAGEASRSAEQERRNSLDLQRGLLPAPIPPVAGASVAVRYRPSGAGVEVGGDWYDVLALPNGSVGVAIGDVMGHDLQSAARMAQARSALRAYASEGHGVAGVMERLNRLMVTTDPSFMGTCCYLEFDALRGTVEMVLAGHPPPLLMSRDGLSFVDVVPGLPLGVEESARYAATAVAFGPRSTLLLYTDGLVETRESSLSEGLDRLLGMTKVFSHRNVERMADEVLEAMVPDAVPDDVALVVLRAEGGLPPAQGSSVRSRQQI